MLLVQKGMVSSRWKPPDSLLVKINFNVAFREQLHQSSSGWVIKNELGLVMGSGVILHNNVVDTFLAEALAFWQALIFARNMRFRDVG